MGYWDEASVLVIDDSRLCREQTFRLLKRAGVGHVDMAESGTAGFQKAIRRDPPYDLIFLDLHMPMMDGVQISRLLHAAGSRQSLVLMSDRGPGLLKLVSRLGSMGRNIRGALEKPLRLDTIMGVLAAEAERLGRAEEALLEGPAKVSRVSIEDLEQALDRTEIQPYYQPKVDARTGAMRGVEALARWLPQAGGLVSPNHFIGMAEDTGRIGRLTTAIFIKALEDMRAWRKAGLNTRVSVNISASLLAARELPDELEGLAHRHGVQTSDVILEITESKFVSEAPAVTEVLARLALKGFELSVDDFGTGYASLELLSRLPVAELKVDRCFVHGAGQDESVRALQASSVQLARALHLRSVAEGVETESDWIVASMLGCDELQGYRLARPMPAEKLPAWAAEHSPDPAELIAGA